MDSKDLEASDKIKTNNLIINTKTSVCNLSKMAGP